MSVSFEHVLESTVHTKMFRHLLRSLPENLLQIYLKDDTDKWLQLNGPVNFSYFYSKCYFKLVL